MKTCKENTFAAMNNGFLDTSDMTINKDYLNDTLQLLLSNERPLYDAMINKRMKPYSVAWQTLIFLANRRLDADFYPQKFVATSDHLKAWLKEWGSDYSILQDTIEYIENERKELEEFAQKQKKK